MVDDLLHQRGVFFQGVFAHIGAVFPHHRPDNSRLFLHGGVLDTAGIPGGDLINIVGVDHAALDGFAKQGVHDGEQRLDLIGCIGKTALNPEASHHVHGLQGCFGIAAADRLQQAAFGGIALFQHAGRQFLLKGRLVEIAGIGAEIHGQELTHLRGRHQRQLEVVCGHQFSDRLQQIDLHKEKPPLYHNTGNR